MKVSGSMILRSTCDSAAKLTTSLNRQFKDFFEVRFFRNVAFDKGISVIFFDVLKVFRIARVGELIED